MSRYVSTTPSGTLSICDLKNLGKGAAAAWNDDANEMDDGWIWSVEGDFGNGSFSIWFGLSGS